MRTWRGFGSLPTSPASPRSPFHTPTPAAPAPSSAGSSEAQSRVSRATAVSPGATAAFLHSGSPNSGRSPGTSAGAGPVVIVGGPARRVPSPGPGGRSNRRRWLLAAAAALLAAASLVLVTMRPGVPSTKAVGPIGPRFSRSTVLRVPPADAADTAPARGGGGAADDRADGGGGGGGSGIEGAAAALSAQIKQDMLAHDYVPLGGEGVVESAADVAAGGEGVAQAAAAVATAAAEGAAGGGAQVPSVVNRTAFHDAREGQSAGHRPQQTQQDSTISSSAAPLAPAMSIVRQQPQQELPDQLHHQQQQQQQQQQGLPQGRKAVPGHPPPQQQQQQQEQVQKVVPRVASESADVLVHGAVANRAASDGMPVAAANASGAAAVVPVVAAAPADGGGAAQRDVGTADDDDEQDTEPYSAPQEQVFGSGALHRAREALARHTGGGIPRIIHQMYGLYDTAGTPRRRDRLMGPGTARGRSAAAAPGAAPRRRGLRSWVGGPELSVQSWTSMNPGYTHIMWGPDDVSALVETMFPSFVPLFRSFKRMPVLRADLARYLLVFAFGGVYSDTDTLCLRPVEGWADGLAPHANISAVVAVEADARAIPHWERYWGRMLQFCQWTFAAEPAHPLLAHVVFRIFQLVERVRVEDLVADDVIHVTGPSVMTDAMYDYLRSKGRNWTEFEGLTHGTLVDDVLVLPITAFSPGVGHMGAGPVGHTEARVQHLFGGSWRKQGQEQQQQQQQPSAQSGK